MVGGQLSVDSGDCRVENRYSDWQLVINGWCLVKDSLERDKQVRLIILIEGLANLVVLGAKLIVGLSTGSLAVLGDAIHSLTDVINNVVAWVVIRYSSMPADRGHPYGHRKFETLAVFALASLLVVLAFELGLHAIRKEATDVVSGGIELGIMLGVLTVNICLATWQRMWALRLDSDILLADANHTFADVLTTIVVIAGWQFSAMGYLWLDRVCAIGVAGLIMYLAYILFKRAVPVLVDESAIDPQQLSRVVSGVPGVAKVYRVRSRWMGSARAVDMIISVDPTLSTEESHAIADEIESIIEQQFDVSDISIHVEPK